MDDVHKLADLFRKLMKMLVDNQTDLKLEVIPDEACAIFRVTVAQCDMGMLVGKKWSRRGFPSHHLVSNEHENKEEARSENYRSQEGKFG
jgi:hypothetical protein